MSNPKPHIELTVTLDGRKVGRSLAQIRPCACGCDRPARPNGTYATDACRARAWKEATNYVHPRDRTENAENGAENARPRKPRRSDVRFTYDRVRERFGPDVDELLTPAQRKRLKGIV